MLHGVVGFFAEEAGHAAEAGASTSHTPAPPPELIFYLFGNPNLPVTNTLLTAWVAILVLVLVSMLATRKLDPTNTSRVPSGLQNFMELVVELWLGISERTMGWKRGRFLALIGTAFLFIVTCNWLGTLPIGYLWVTNPEGHTVPLFRSPNSDLNLTAALAIMMIVLAEFFEFRSLGGGGYIKGLIIPNPLRWLEIFTRPLSLSFRLFGNIFAGEVLLLTMLAIAPFVLFVFIGLELFVGLIQALIFAMLSLVFLSIATVHEDQHNEPGEHDSLEDDFARATHGQPF